MENRMNFKIYDMPPELVERLVNFAKTRSGNRVWVSIQTLLDFFDSFQSLAKVAELEARIKSLEDSVNKKEKEDELKPILTLGGGGE